MCLQSLERAQIGEIRTAAAWQGEKYVYGSHMRKFKGLLGVSNISGTGQETGTAPA